jgi:hypothetical protein
MTLDRPDTEIEGGGNLAVTHPGGDELQDFGLAFREPGRELPRRWLRRGLQRGSGI